MNQLLSIVDNKIVIEKLRVPDLEGPTSISGDLTVNGQARFTQSVLVDKDLYVHGTVEIDYLKVKNLVTDDSRQLDAFTFTSEKLSGLEGKGLVWQQPDQTHQFILRTEPRRIWSSESIDLHKSASYQIGGVDVVQADRLGNAVLHSNLRSVGVLDSLKVRGDASLSETLFSNGALGRVGVNTDQPNAALSVVDDLVEVVIGLYKEDQAYVGTWGNTILNIGTDNTARLTIQDNNFTFGSAKSQNAQVKINGQLEVSKLKVNELVADTRVERSTPLEFVESADNPVYGKGIIWKGTGVNCTFLLLPNPNRLQTSAHISLDAGREFLISGNTVLSETKLGDAVVDSNLRSVGTLTALNVDGPINLSNAATVQDGKLTANSIFSIANEAGTLVASTRSLATTNEDFKISVNGTVEFAAYANGNIQIGNKENTTRVINTYGKLAVNVTNPRSDSAFEVSGNIVINGRKQVPGTGIPEDGQWAKGDIVWNSNPEETSYIGWVCVMSGTPGSWKPFGYIGER